MAGKGDRNRSISKDYKDNFDKIDKSKPVSTAGFKMRINGKEVIGNDKATKD